MKKMTGWIAILASLLLGACASQGDAVRILGTMPGGEKFTIVAHNQSVPDWMLARDKLKLNFVVRGALSATQLTAVAETERACRIYTGTVRPSNLVAVLSNGVLYAGAGFVGIGLGAKAAFDGAKFTDYGKYGGYAGVFQGAANGIVTLGGQTYTFENCGREVLGLFPGYGVRIIEKSPY